MTGVDTVINFADAKVPISDRTSFSYVSKLPWRVKVFGLGM
jgi:hypothetical protein